MATLRLVNTRTVQLEEGRNAENSTTKYAILSHCWLENAGDEISFQDLNSRRDCSRKPGYSKLKTFCQIALSLGYEKAWIDTACIYKESTAELSSALQSMYRWYSEADVCIAQLAETGDGGKIFKDDKWFTRGWTLQELIAPNNNMRFYDKDWKFIGEKRDLLDRLSARTNIPVAILNHDARPQSCSIAQRMSWAANRNTTRIEDRAYSLLGLFDVGMNMIYGEREGAFIRLQEEILRHSADQTIFAWALPLEKSPSGLLAPSPDAFADSGDVVPCSNDSTFALSNGRLEIRLPTLPHSIGTYHAFLDCEDPKDCNMTCAILITRLSGQDQWARVTDNEHSNLIPLKKDHVQSLKPTVRRICVRQEQDPIDPPMAFRRTNGFWLRTLEPPKHTETSCEILSRSGPAREYRVYLSCGHFGHAGTVHFRPHSSSKNHWGQVRWLCVGFDDDFNPVVLVANCNAYGLGFINSTRFSRALEAGPNKKGHDAPFSSAWIRESTLRDQQSRPTPRQGWPDGYFILRCDSNNAASASVKEGTTYEYRLHALDLRICVSLIEDTHPQHMEKSDCQRGALVGPTDISKPRYIWTLDVSSLDFLGHSPEQEHRITLCRAAFNYVACVLFAMPCLMYLNDDCMGCDDNDFGGRVSQAVQEEGGAVREVLEDGNNPISNAGKHRE